MSSPTPANPALALGGLLRKRRKQMELTLKVLSDRAGVSAGYLSLIERDMAVPSLGTLAQLADALDVSIDYFVKSTKPADALSRASGREKFSIAGSSITYEALSNDYPGSEISSYIMHVPANYTSETVSHEGEEIIFILEGTIEQTLDGQTFTMTAGDSLHYSGTVPHSWANPSDNEAKILWSGRLTVLNASGTRKVPPSNRPQIAGAGN